MKIEKQEIGIVLLAAGAGKRFGGNKLSAYVDEEKMYVRAMNLIASQPNVNSVVVVTGNEEIADEAKKRSMGVAWNIHPEIGISRSIRLGIEKILKTSSKIDGIMFMVSDQPWIQKETIRKMLDGFNGGIFALRYEGCPGNPVIFSKSYFSELMELTGDVGGRQVMKRHEKDIYYLEALNEKELRDIDRREQLSEQEDL